MTHQNKMDEPALTPAEINQARAYIYQWFSQQFQTELTELQWQAVVTGKLRPFFELLAENGLSTEVEAYETALAQLAESAGSKARLILASDFAHAFLLSGKDSVLPYAAAYDTNAQGMLYGATAEIMKQFLQGVGLALAKDFKEPEDHLAVYLAALSHMTQTTSLAEQKQFLDEALMSWLPSFTSSCQALSLQSAVYPALAQLLLAFIRQDLQFLDANSIVAVQS